MWQVCLRTAWTSSPRRSFRCSTECRRNCGQSAFASRRDWSPAAARARVCCMKPSKDISRLIEIMAALRAPKTGCPWD
ncbi:MAG: hypothetical protein E5W41_03440, partial [Mesorhizobium sp.]